MKKIAIYGDSFAADYKGWPKHIQNYTNAEVITFGMAGSSIPYSYVKFLETHEDYDVIIFLWTSYFRNGLVSDKLSSHNTRTLKHYVSFNPTIELESIFLAILKTKKNYPNDTENLDENIKDWVKSEIKNSLIYTEKNLLSSISMRDSVKLRRPDSINIECFDFEYIEKNTINLNYLKNIFGMYNIGRVDMEQFSKNKFLDENTNIRRNHMTPIQNKEFAYYVKELLINKEFDIHKTFKNPEKYYTMSKTLEESGFIL